MNIADRLDNFEMLKERLEKSESKDALVQLAMIRINALEEFRQLIYRGRTITIDGVEYSAINWRPTPAEEKEKVIFELGWSCLVEANVEASGEYFNHNVTLRQLAYVPHCAMLHVLTMIEHTTDGEGAPLFPSTRYNYCLLDDDNNTFRELLSKINLFYPKILVGTVEAG